MKPKVNKSIPSFVLTFLLQVNLVLSLGFKVMNVKNFKFAFEKSKV